MTFVSKERDLKVWYHVECRGIVGESGGPRTNLTNVFGETQDEEHIIWCTHVYN